MFFIVRLGALRRLVAVSIILLSTQISTAVATTTETVSLHLFGAISKSISIVFDDTFVDLGNLTAPTTIDFTVIANTQYIVSAPAKGMLVNSSGDALGFSTSIHNGKLTITPDEIGEDQPLGLYSTNIAITISAI